MPTQNGPAWIDFEEFDTSEPVTDILPVNCFEQIAKAHLAAGFGRQGYIGSAESYLFEAPDLVRFGIDWLEQFARPK